MTAKPQTGKLGLFHRDSLAAAAVVGIVVAIWVRTKGELAFGAAGFGIGAAVAGWICEGGYSLGRNARDRSPRRRRAWPSGCLLCLRLASSELVTSTCAASRTR